MPQPTSSVFPPVASFLDSLALAPRQAHKLLTIWPLLRSASTAAPPFVSLADALARGDVEVTELPQGASVPHVLVSNRGGVAVLVLFGEELRGALENRTANASFLIAPHGQVEIDVSCVEQGRWSSRSLGGLAFGSSGDVLSHALRAKMHGKVTRSRERGLRFAADQGEVWGEVGQRIVHACADAPSSAYADYVSTRARDLAEASAAFAVVPGQVGFVAAIGEEIVGLEAIGRPEVFANAFAGLLRAYLIDAIDASLVRERREAEGEAASRGRRARPGRHAAATPEGSGATPQGATPQPTPPRFDAPEPFLAALREAPATTGPSLGLGIDARLTGEGACGCALVEEDVVHLTAFPQSPESGEGAFEDDDDSVYAEPTDDTVIEIVCPPPWLPGRRPQDD